MRGKARRILIYRVGHLGDTLIALPALLAVRQSFHGAHISLLSNAHLGNDRVTTQDVMPNGLIDDWLTYPSSDGPTNPLSMVRLLTLLRRERFDTLVYLAPRLRSRFDVKRDLAFFRLAGIRNFIGHTGFEALREKGVGAPLPAVEHEADHLLRRLSLSGISVPAPGEAQIDLMLRSEEHDAADVWLRDNVLMFGAGELVGFGPASKWPSKVWPEERFAELGRQLIGKCDVYPLVFGGSEDRGLGDRLIAAWGKGANAAGVLRVRHTAAALSRCQLFVGNDTGTMHLAAAVGTSCVVTMSAQDWPGRWNPYGKGHTVLRRQVSCEGCMLKICTHEGLRCLKEISVEEVVEACEGVLRAKSEEQGAGIRNQRSIAI